VFPPRKHIILVVEDDPQLRALYRDALNLVGGFTAVAVEDGVDALRFIDTQTPDAVLLDWALPRLGGRDVAAELSAHATTRDIPIIVNERGTVRAVIAAVSWTGGSFRFALASDTWRARRRTAARLARQLC
jgi:DNA-binding response OmpR family regulator